MATSQFFFAGSASQVLGERMATLANKPLAKWQPRQFNDGELSPVLQENVKNARVVLIQSTYPPAEHMMELLLMIDAAKHAGAYKVIVVAPYLGYMRQDKLYQPGEAYGAALQARLLSTAGADQLITCNPHTKDVDFFFKGPVQQISSYPLFIPYLENLRLANMCFIAPDRGAAAEAARYASYFNTNLVVCHKIRSKPNEIEAIEIIGMVKNAHAILIDDLVDTGNTLCMVAQQLKNQGAHSVRALCTHSVFSGHAYDRLAVSALEEIVVTNTIPLRQKSQKVKVLDIAPCILQVMDD